MTKCLGASDLPSIQAKTFSDSHLQFTSELAIYTLRETELIMKE